MANSNVNNLPEVVALATVDAFLVEDNTNLLSSKITYENLALAVETTLFDLRRIVAIAYDASAIDHTIFVQTSLVGAACTINLPDVSLLFSGKELTILDSDGDANTYNIIINAFGSDLINGASSITLDKSFSVIKIKKIGANWNVISRFG